MVFLGTPTLTLPPSLNAVKPDFASVTREFSFLFNCEFRAGVPGVVILTPDLGVAKGGLLFAALSAALVSAAFFAFLLEAATHFDRLAFSATPRCMIPSIESSTQ